MALDLHKTAGQVGAMSIGLKRAGTKRASRLEAALGMAREPLREVELPLLQLRFQAARPPRARVTWLTAGIEPEDLQRIATPVALPSVADSYSALATDGSQIELDRHGPARCFLINIGGAQIEYGEVPSATLFSAPQLFARPEELAIADPAGVREVGIDETLLAVKRMVMECEALAERASRLPQEVPMLLLLDGSLVLWSLSGSRYPDHVRAALLEQGLMAALAKLQELVRGRQAAFASYISNPHSTEVINLLRLTACPHEELAMQGCDAICGHGPGRRECDRVAAGLTDRDLFERLLAPGERSVLFASQSPIVMSEYGEHAVRFCYLNVGSEIVRLEFPAWLVAEPGAIDLLHGLVFDQCRKGRGYPVALQEAHEKAVVSAGDRRLFWGLVEQALARAGVEVSPSEKARSKRMRAV